MCKQTGGGLGGSMANMMMARYSFVRGDVIADDRLSALPLPGLVAPAL